MNIKYLINETNHLTSSFGGKDFQSFSSL